MQKKKKIILIVIVVLLLLILAGLAIWRIKSNNSENSRRQAPLTNIILGKITRGEILKIESLTGNIIPIQQANIYSKVSGNIERIYVDIGSQVRIGQILALIDTTIYSQNAKQANANYGQMVANLENAKLLYDRNKTLLEQNLIAKQDVDNAHTAYDVAMAQKDAAYANYVNSVTQLSYCRITAPFSGYITKRYFDAGVYVTSSTTVASSVIFTLMDVDTLKAEINIPENDVRLIPQILDISIQADALPGLEFKGKLKKTAEAVDLSTRTMAAEVYIPNSEKLLKPGMFVKINLIMDKKTDALLVPNNVIMNDQYGDFIYVVYPDTTAHKKYVKIGIQQNTTDEIVGGVDENEQVVFTGQNLIKDGSKVRITK